MKPTRIATMLVLAATALLPVRAAAENPETEVRALWITRWDYRKPEDVRKIVENSVSLNFNVLLFQTRGNGTVFYRSEIEPWAWELTGEDASTTGQDPGWDPLAVAIEEAHRHGVELHAYMNVFPAWRSQEFPPRDSGQLWWEHPDWFMCDASGRRMIPRDPNDPDNPKPAWYSFLSPGVPEVQDYLASLFEEVVANYDVDGIHYDYIRYPHEIHEVGADYKDREKALGNWSYDPVSLARFAKETGVASPDLDPEAWTRWRAAQITEFVRKADALMRSHDPDIFVSAAVMADPDDAYRTKYQDYVTWMQKGWLNAAVTMGYTSDNEKYEARMEDLKSRRVDGQYIVPGLSLGNDAETVGTQVGLTRSYAMDGFAGFAYSHLFDRDNGHAPRELAGQLLEGPFRDKARLPWDDDNTE